jgi:hypothetical protein
MVDGKKVPVGMRECCSTCQDVLGTVRSLVAHICQRPSVSTLPGKGTVPVQIVPRTKPFVRGF